MEPCQPIQCARIACPQSRSRQRNMVMEIATKRFATGKDAALILMIKQQEQPRTLDGASAQYDMLSRNGEVAASFAGCRYAADPAVCRITGEAHHGRIQPHGYFASTGKANLHFPRDVTCVERRPFRNAWEEIVVFSWNECVGSGPAMVARVGSCSSRISTQSVRRWRSERSRLTRRPYGVINGLATSLDTTLRRTVLPARSGKARNGTALTSELGGMPYLVAITRRSRFPRSTLPISRSASVSP